jgi:hypothetical protein
MVFTLYSSHWLSRLACNTSLKISTDIGHGQALVKIAVLPSSSS